MANNGELVRLRGSTYYENFTVNGRRFRGSLKTESHETAVIIATKTKSDALLGKLTNKRPEMTLNAAFARYLLEVARDRKAIKRIGDAGVILCVAMGNDVVLSEISTAVIGDFITHRSLGQITHKPDGRRKGLPVANGTVNGDLRYLRAVMNRAKKRWKIVVPEDIVWGELFLPEAERQHILEQDEQNAPASRRDRESEEARLFKALRDDFRAFIRFGLITGLRLSNIINLKWSQVKWGERHIEFHVKSKKPGGKIHYVPIVKSVEKILDGEKGRHPVYVFHLGGAAQ